MWATSEFRLSNAETIRQKVQKVRLTRFLFWTHIQMRYFKVTSRMSLLPMISRISIRLIAP